MTHRIPKEAWGKISKVIFQHGYLCYHDEEGCHFVLREIVEILDDYEMICKK